MVSFVQKRLQVFVSSTYTDLIAERQAAVEAILTAGHIPAGMELFAAGDESQLDVIRQWIDESDAYMLILGGRYGSVEPKSGKSYTQLEYEYAAEHDKPLFACVLKDEALDPRVRKFGPSVMETEYPQELKAFRALVLSRMVRFWEDLKDIKIAVAEALGAIARRETLAGWVRADQQANVPALADEIARLSRENSELRSRLEQLSKTERYNGLSFDQVKTVCGEEAGLDLLDQLREFHGRFGYIDPSLFSEALPALEKLCAMGLLARRGGVLELTEPGQGFLNRLLLERHDAASAEPNQEAAGSPEPRDSA